MGFIFLRVSAWLAALPYVAIALLVATGGPTWSSVAYVVAIGVALLGLMTLPFPDQPFQRRRGLSRAGAAAFVVVGLLRVFTLGDGKTLHVTDGDGGGPRRIGRFVDEADIAVNAARALSGIGMLHDDTSELSATMRGEYARMRLEQGDVASPVVATHLGLQRPSAFDLVLVEGSEPARGAVVFLHGSGGSFGLPCWQIARAVRSLGAATACPSTRWTGDWGSDDGEATLRRTLDLLRARGIRRFVLVGLSAGGYGASLLAPRMKGSFAGLLLISGADPGAAHAGVPTLVIQGRHDTMVDPADPGTYAVRTGARYVDIDAGHFALLVRSGEVEPEIRAFVEACLPLGD